MHPLLVVPPHVVVQLQLEIAQARELLPAQELSFQRLVGRLVDGAVERAAHLRERPGSAEDLKGLVERRVVEFRPPAYLDFPHEHHVRLPSTVSAWLAISLATAAAFVAAGLYARQKKSRR